MVRKLYAFVERALTYPARYHFQVGELRIIADALAAHERKERLTLQAHAETVIEMLESGMPALNRFRWSQLNERLLALAEVEA